MMRLIQTCRVGLCCLLISLVSACANMSGIEGETKVNCAADTQGMPCTPLSKVFEANKGGLLGAGKKTEASSAPTQSEGNLGAERVALNGTGRDYFAERPALSSGMPVRTPARVLRIWIAPWEDSNFVLNDQKLVYVQVDAGRWMIEHNARNIMDQFSPTRLVQGQGVTIGRNPSTSSLAPVQGGQVTNPLSGNSGNVLQQKPNAQTLDQLGIRTQPQVGNGQRE